MSSISKALFVAASFGVFCCSCAPLANPSAGASAKAVADVPHVAGPISVSSTAVVTTQRANQGAAQGTVHGIEMGDGDLSLSWKYSGTSFKPDTFTDRLTGQSTSLGTQVFRLNIEGKSISASDMIMAGAPAVESLAPDPMAVQAAARLPGKKIIVNLTDKTGNVHAVWSAVGRDGSNYLREELTLAVVTTAIPLRNIVMLELPLRFPHNVGSVAGSPVVAGDVFCGLEHPMATNEIDGDVRCSLDRAFDLEPGQTVTVSSVIGVTRPGQLRRDFLAYIEQERARPYQPLLHYNSWYDIGYFTPFHESDAVGAINAFGTELTEKRGVKLDSFLFDDGWDNHQSLWGFNDGFPNGFTPLKDAAAKFGAAPGVWLSPWGGYGKPRAQRLEYGKRMNYETNAEGYALSGPKYYERFRQVCIDFVNKYGVNQFKFDGTGNATGHYPGSHFGSDFEAAIQLIQDLKALKPDLYVNLTTGTWPSPFWLRYADSIWRGGEDHTFTGVGTFRQRWITYRDGDTYRGIVQAGPLYPINSLMLHGLIFARSSNHLNIDPGNDFADEVHSYFGSGTQLQEMYITHTLLSDQNWDTLAEAAKWSRANSDTLVDTHWIGGNPWQGQAYGWAAWSPKKGIITLRNPSDEPCKFDLDIATALELPPGAAMHFEGKSPWKADDGRPAISFTAGRLRTIDLAPFQVITFELTPKPG